MGVGGVDVITWSSVGTVLIAIVASPAVAFALACGAMLLIIWIRRCFKNLTEDATVFRVLQVRICVLSVYCMCIVCVHVCVCVCVCVYVYVCV